MTLKEYQGQAVRTLAELNSEQLNYSHMGIGIVSEFSELLDAINKEDRVNIGEEIGDMLWYISNYYTMRGYELHSLEPSFIGFGDASKMDIGVIVMDIAYRTSVLAGYIKSFMAYDRPIDKSVELDCLYELSSAIGALTWFYNIKLSSILDRNIAKLKARFPQKFSIEDANTRNLDNERKILES